MNSLKTLVVVGAFSIMGQLIGSAATIAAWDINDVDLNNTGDSGIDGNSTSSPYTFSATTKNLNLQSATLTLSSSVNSTDSASQYGFKIPGADEQTTLGGAITEGHYLEINLIAASGYHLDLSSLGILGQSTSSGADNVAILSSVDGFFDDKVLASVDGISGDTGGFDTDGSGFGAPINLSATKFQDLSSISFRIYGWNSSSGAGLTYLRNLSGDDLVVDGSLALIPEPTSALAGGLLAMGLLYRNRRQFS